MGCGGGGAGFGSPLGAVALGLGFAGIALSGPIGVAIGLSALGALAIGAFGK